jgi:hypothetical protein
LFENPYLSPANDHQRISCLSFLTDDFIFLKGLGMNLGEQRLELLFLEFREEGNGRKRLNGSGLLILFGIELCESVVNVFPRGIDPQNNFIHGNGLEQKALLPIGLRHLSIFLDGILLPAQSLLQFSHLQPGSKILRLLGTMLLKIVKGLDQIALGEGTLSLLFIFI